MSDWEMVPMQRGQLFIGRAEGAVILRLTGDLRHVSGDSTATSLQIDAFLEKRLGAEGKDRLIIDLREALAIDSTHLGLLARLAAPRSSPDQVPVLVSTRPKITRLIKSMGMDILFELVDAVPEGLDAGEAAAVPREGGVRHASEVVLKAHRALAALNEANRAQFEDVVSLLEEELERG